MYRNVFIGAEPDGVFLAELHILQKSKSDWPIHWFVDDDLVVILTQPWHINRKEEDGLVREMSRLAKPLDGFDLFFDTAITGPDILKPEIMIAEADLPQMLRVFQDYLFRDFGFEEQKEILVPHINLGTIKKEFIVNSLPLNLRTHVSDLILYESIYPKEIGGYVIINRIKLGD
jgi:hypothetical protein